MFTIKGKVAIITGPSGGIGKGVAMKFAEAGFDIFGVDYADCAELKKEIEEKFGTKLEYMQADLTKTNAALAEKIVESAVKAFGRADVLINNAGIARRCDAIDYKEEDWNAAITINLTTCFLLSQAVARQYMKQGTGGKIVSLASMLAFSGGIRVPSYAASKHGIAGITKALCNEWAKEGINVNAVAPGYVDTPMNKAHKEDPKRFKELNDRIPFGRWATPEEIAGPILFLCTEEARYINGYVLAVDGGWLAR